LIARAHRNSSFTLIITVIPPDGAEATECSPVTYENDPLMTDSVAEDGAITDSKTEASPDIDAKKDEVASLDCYLDNLNVWVNCKFVLSNADYKFSTICKLC
jgi:hypothetical protein